MIYYLLNSNNDKLISYIGVIFTFIFTCILTHTFKKYLPKDAGREFAHDGKLSAGKPRGAGFIFIIAFIITSIIFVKINKEIAAYLIYTAAAMLTGFLDDCAKSPWGEYKKGLLDLIIAFMVSLTFLSFNSNVIRIGSEQITIHPVVFVILSVILVWTSINVTNCADGVDGLSGILGIVTLGTIIMVFELSKPNLRFEFFILLFCMCILGYLWFNMTPSILIMGDAGSRAMGLFIAIAVLKTGNPLIYIPAAFLLLMDGGLGLVKVFLLRFLKIRILSKTRTPLHDHVRKVWTWSNTQVVFRFATIQVLISIALIALIQIWDKK